MNLLDNNRNLAEHKLILLYMINSFGTPVSNLQITRLILENNFMNYFLLQQFLKDLCERKLLSFKLIDDKNYYSITSAGKQTLGYFIHLIPTGIQSRINDTIPTIKKSMRNETSITADFFEEGEKKFTVSCKVKEDDFTLLDINIAVGTKKDARTICENWKKHSGAIYSEVIDSFTKNRE